MTACSAEITTSATACRRTRIGVRWAAVCGALMLGPIPALAAAAWVDQQNIGPFICRSDFPLAEIQPLLGELGQLQSDIVSALEVPAAQTAIEVYLFRSKGNYDQFLARYLPKVPYRRALYVKEKGNGRVFAYRSSQLDTDLRHECTHALLHAVLPMVPLWLDEGLAVYFEQPPARRAFDSPHLGPVRWSVKLGGVEGLEGLEKKKDVGEMDRSDYRAAWAWVHFMLHGPPDARDELVRFLADIRAAAPPGRLGQRLRERLGNPAGLLSAHFQGWSRTSSRAPGGTEVLAPFLRTDR
jgi:hypothetical protein